MGGATAKKWLDGRSKRGFNAARGFVGGATRAIRMKCYPDGCFNAARGFVGGATASLATLVPLGEKSSFGKSPEI